MVDWWWVWLICAGYLGYKVGECVISIGSAKVIAKLTIDHHKELRKRDGWNVLEQIVGPTTRDYTSEELSRAGFDEEAT